MKSKTLRRIAGTALFAALAMPVRIIAQDPSAITEEKQEHTRYIVTDLGTLPGGTFSEASVLNGNGLVGGTASRRDGTWRAALWYGRLKIDIGGRGSEDRTVKHSALTKEPRR